MFHIMTTINPTLLNVFEIGTDLGRRLRGPGPKKKKKKLLASKIFPKKKGLGPP